jgi:hypothetical protein
MYFFYKREGTRVPLYIQGLWRLHCKKRLSFFPSLAGMSLTKFSLAGNNLIIPGRGESLVSDIPTGDGKNDNLFYSVLNELTGDRRKISQNHRNAESCVSSCSAPSQAQFFREFCLKLRGTVPVPEIQEVISKMREMYTLATFYNTNCTKSFYKYVHNFSVCHLHAL